MVGGPTQVMAMNKMGRIPGLLSYPAVGKAMMWTSYVHTLDGQSDARSAEKVPELSPIGQATVFLRKQYTIVVGLAGVTSANIDTEYAGAECGRSPNGITYHATKGAYDTLQATLMAMMREGIPKDTAYQRHAQGGIAPLQGGSDEASGGRTASPSQERDDGQGWTEVHGGHERNRSGHEATTSLSRCRDDSMHAG